MLLASWEFGRIESRRYDGIGQLPDGRAASVIREKEAINIESMGFPFRTPEASISKTVSSVKILDLSIQSSDGGRSEKLGQKIYFLFLLGPTTF